MKIIPRKIMTQAMLAYKRAMVAVEAPCFMSAQAAAAQCGRNRWESELVALRCHAAHRETAAV